MFLLLAAADVRAQQDDLRRVLEQGSELRHQQQDQQRLQQAESQRPTLTLDGQTVRVERTVDDLGQALYLSLQHQQWQAAAAFLAEYIELPGHDPLLRHYAQGALARVAGDHSRAAQAYEALLAAQPDFLPARLELARVMPKTSATARRWHCSVQSRPVSTATIRPPRCAHAWTAI